MKDYKNKFDKMKNFIVGTGFAISLGFITSCTEIQKNFQTTEIVTRKIAGEDRTIDYGESRKALDALGYKGIILNDRERIYFKADQWGDNKIEIYVGTEAPDKPLNDYRLLGSMKRDELEKRILNTFEDHKK